MQNFQKEKADLLPVQRHIAEYLQKMYCAFYKWDRIYKTLPKEEMLALQLRYIHGFINTFIKLEESANLLDRILSNQKDDFLKNDFRQALEEAEAVMTEVVQDGLDRFNFQEAADYLTEEIKTLLIDTNNHVIRHLQSLKNIYNLLISKGVTSAENETPAANTKTGLEIFSYPVVIGQDTEDFFKNRKK